MLSRFLTGLRESGRVLVPPPGALTAAHLSEAIPLLRAMDVDARGDAPAGVPVFHEDAAVWGATTLFRACQAFVHRELDAEGVNKLLAEACPPAPPAEAAWSADLALRALPDLVAMARGVAEGDPLLERLMALARAWPLSSVGVRGLEDVDAEVVAEHAGLRALYVDRILERGDISRLADPRVAEAAREALGGLPELCPEAAAVLHLGEAR